MGIDGEGSLWFVMAYTSHNRFKRRLFSANSEIWVWRNVWVVTVLLNGIDLSKKIVNDAVELAKVNAVNVLKGLKFDDIKSLVEAEMASIIKPLEDETKTTTSYWVKIRNRIYITVLNNSINSIVNSI